MKGNTKDKVFLGQGLAYPLQFDPRGGLALASGERDIEQAIRIILGTSPGERRMRPEFGCQAKELLFAPHNSATKNMMIYYVRQALGRWEPRIDVDQVLVSEDAQDDGVLFVEVRYTIKDTHDERSIVYPFFIVNEGER